MTYDFVEYMEQLHKASDEQLVSRARSQFQSTDEQFHELLTEYSKLGPKARGEFLREHGLSSNDDASSTGNNMALAVSEQTGRFLANLTLATRPKTILELGSSCGVSTLYFANALKTIGSGQVIATEFDPWKLEQLNRNIDAVDLGAYVKVCDGDVMKTIKTIKEPVDLAFIDIWATAYLPAFKLLRPLLPRGSIVLADNIFTAGASLHDFTEAVSSDTSLSTTMLDFESGLAFIVVL